MYERQEEVEIGARSDGCLQAEDVLLPLRMPSFGSLSRLKLRRMCVNAFLTEMAFWLKRLLVLDL